MKKSITYTSLIALLMAGIVIAAEQMQISVKTAPPVVVKTVPQAGDNQVDSNIKEIRVTYSKDMMDKSWSPTQISDDSFPEIGGEIRYDKDKRTCVLPVKLQPGKAYAILLNSNKFRNFKDTGGQPAMPYMLVFETKK